VTEMTIFGYFDLQCSLYMRGSERAPLCAKSDQENDITCICVINAVLLIGLHFCTIGCTNKVFQILSHVFEHRTDDSLQPFIHN